MSFTNAKLQIGEVQTNNENVKMIYIQPLNINPDEEYMYGQGCIGSECFDKFIIPSSAIDTFQIQKHLSSGDFAKWSGDSRYGLLDNLKYVMSFIDYNSIGKVTMIVMVWLDQIKEADKKSDSKDSSHDENETVYKKECVEVSIKTLNCSGGIVSLETPIEISLPLLISKQ